MLNLQNRGVDRGARIAPGLAGICKREDIDTTMIRLLINSLPQLRGEHQQIVASESIGLISTNVFSSSEV